MKTVLINFEDITPTELKRIIKSVFPTTKCECSWTEGSPYYEIAIANVADLARLERVLAKWV